MATYIISADILFKVEAENKEDATEKAWTLLDINLPKQFDTETTELDLWKEDKYCSEQ